MSDSGDTGRGGSAALELLGGEGSSLLDAVDSLIDRGVLLEGDLVLGLADVDLIYLKLSTLLAAADRILGKDSPAPYDEHRPPGRSGVTPGEGAHPEPDEPPEGVGAEPASARDEAARPHVGPADLDALRTDLERSLQGEEDTETDPPSPPPRWNAAPEDVERSVARLVLALVEFLRKLMERQAIRRMDEGTLTEAEVERLGRALMRLEETVHDMARRFGLTPEELNLDLGPLGRLT